MQRAAAVAAPRAGSRASAVWAVAAAVAGVLLVAPPQPVTLHGASGRAPHERAVRQLDPALAMAASAAIGAHERRYAVVRRAGLPSARGGGVRSVYAPSGPRFATAAGRFHLRLLQVGSRRAAGATVRTSGNRVAYVRPGVVEWYRNGPLGVEQGFRIAGPRPRRAAGPLVLRLRTSGATPRVGGPAAATFHAAGGAVLARYDGLSVRDARGRRLPAHLTARGQTLAIVVDDRRARYPVVVDPIVQQGAKLAPSDASVSAEAGLSVALSGDGSTALVGAPFGGDGGSAWAFVADDGQWVQQGPRLTPDDGGADTTFGYSVALSADGDTALIGGYLDDDHRGAAWAFVRSGGTWSQEGAKLLPADPDPATPVTFFGSDVALSADGDTALVGGYGDRFGYGAAWAFVRDVGTWEQQGPKLTAPGETLGTDGTYSWLGFSVALSADGDTALVGGVHDENATGAAWTFMRSGGAWALGQKLVASSEQGPGRFGESVALSADGQTALVGANADADDAGAAWAFDRSGSTWTSASPKLTAPDADGAAQFGGAVALSGDGTRAIVGGLTDHDGAGAAWTFARSSGAWSSEGAKLVPSDSTELPWFGSDVASSSDGQRLLVGGPGDNGTNGAAWVLAPAAAPLTRPQLSVWLHGDLPLGALPEEVDLSAGATPTGTLTFRIYGPNADNCTGRPLATTSIPVSDNGSYETDALKVSTIGLYWGTVSYSGDAHNAAIATACGSPYFQIKARATITLDATGAARIGSPLDLGVRLHDGMTPTGTVHVEVYGTADPDCTDTPVLTRAVDVVDGRPVPSIPFTPEAIGRFRVVLDYDGDARNLRSFLGCGDPTSTISVTRAKPALVAAGTGPGTVGDPISATATLQNGYHADGSVSFSLFPPSDPTCTGPSLSTIVAPLAGSTATSDAFATRTAGSYRFVARYGGDIANDEAVTPCDAAIVEVARRQPTLALSTHGSADGGGTIAADVELRGGYQPTGNVMVDVYGPDDDACKRSDSLHVLVPLVGSHATPPGFDQVKPGHYQLAASYAGDPNDLPAQTRCGEHAVTVPPGPRPTLRTARALRSRVRLVIGCGSSPHGRCTGEARLVATAARHAHSTRQVMVGRGDYAVTSGRTSSVSIPLTRAGRRLLRTAGRLPITVLLSTTRFGDHRLAARIRLELTARHT